MGPDTHPKAISQTILRLLAEMTGRALHLRAFVSLGLLLEILGLTMTVVYPLTLKDLVDLLAGEGGDHLPLAVTIGLAVVCWAGPNMTSACRHYCTTRICTSLAAEFTRRTMSRQLPILATSAKGDTGAMLGALERLPFSLQMIVDGLMWQVIPLGVQMGVSLTILAGAVPGKYGWLTAGLLAIVLACAYLNARRWKKLSAEMNSASGHLSHVQADVARNARRVVFNGNLAGEVRGIGKAWQAKLNAAEAGACSLIRFSAAQNILLGGGVLLIFYLAAKDIGAGAMSVGMFVLIQTYLVRLTQPAASFVFLILGTGVAIENVRVVLEMAGDAFPDKDVLAAKPAGAAGIRLEKVGFSYGPGLPEISDIDLDIQPSSFVAIVGPSGAGKSTLAQLIAGLKPLDRGRIWLGGADLSSLEPEDRPRHVLYVPQFVSLFDRSLRDNLLYHPANHDEAAVSALLAEFRFGGGEGGIDLDASVGEMGERLSGGQVQKVELARVLGIRVPAMIFDESSSSLDPMSEQLALDRLQSEVQPNTTILFVTHREAIARRADIVIYLHAGQVRAMGPHAELLERSAGYRTLWSGGEIEPMNGGAPIACN